MPPNMTMAQRYARGQMNCTDDGLMNLPDDAIGAACVVLFDDGSVYVGSVGADSEDELVKLLEYGMSLYNTDSDSEVDGVYDDSIGMATHDAAEG